MQTASGAFAALVTSQDQLIDHKLTVGFPVSVPSSYSDLTSCVVSVDLDRAVTTTLPDGTTLISGYPSAAMTVVLAGMLNQAAGVPLTEADTAYRLFNPNDSSSSMWRITRGGLPITWQAGGWDGSASPELITQYTGTVDQVTCSNGVVTLVCRDQRSTITNQATLPPVITQAPQNAGLTSEYAVDYLLRTSSPGRYYSWPEIRQNCVLAVGMRSSLWPQVGSYSTYAQEPTFAHGVYGTGYNGHSAAFGSTFVTYAPLAPLDSTNNIFVEFFGTPGCKIHINDAAVANTVEMYWDGTSGNVQITTFSPSGSTAITAANVPIANGKSYFGLGFTWAPGSTSCVTKLWVGTAGSTVNNTITAKDARNGSLFTVVALLGGSAQGVNGVIEGVQVTTETTPTSNGSFAPTLLIDSGGSLNSLTALPDVSGKDAWSVLQDIAAAEAAVIGFDENGVCRFVNRATIRSMASVRTITSGASLVSLDSLEQMSLCATHIQVPVNQVFIAPVQNVWFASSVITVPPNGSTSFLATTSDPVVNMSTTDVGYWNAGPVGNTWRACTSPDGQGAAVKAGISLQVVQLSSTSLSVTLTNSTPFVLYMVQPVADQSAQYPAGTPFVAIVGQPVQKVTNALAANGSTGTAGQIIADSQWPPVANGGAVANKTFGEVLLPVSPSDWLQDLSSAQGLADALLRDLYYPKPLYRNVTIVPDPRLQLLDRVTLLDPDVSQISDDALLMGISTRMSAGEFSQTIDARAVNRPGAWLLGVAGRSELGVTTFIY